jgi:hypothetical protein
MSQLCERARNEQWVFLCLRSGLEERIDFKISVKLGKSANATYAVLLEAYIEAVKKLCSVNGSKIVLREYVRRLRKHLSKNVQT